MGIKSFVSKWFSKVPKKIEKRFVLELEELSQRMIPSGPAHTLPGYTLQHMEDPKLGVLAATMPADLNLLNGQRMRDPVPHLAAKKRIKNLFGVTTDQQALKDGSWVEQVYDAKSALADEMFKDGSWKEHINEQGHEGRKKS